MVMNLLKIFLIGFIVLGLSNSCSCRLSKESDEEVLLTDSILAVYQDSMAEAPQKVLDVFSGKRLHMQVSLCFYLLLSYESKCYYYLNRMEDAFRTNKEVIRYLRIMLPLTVAVLFWLKHSITKAFIGRNWANGIRLFVY